MTEFFITDVFAEGPYSGNQLATLPDARHLSGEAMQNIAKEFNFSESTFITGGSLETGFDVRIFTPDSELPFAGHPTLGTAFLIREKILQAAVDEVVLNLGVGQIRVSFQGELVWMRQNTPTFGEVLAPEHVARGLGLPVTALDDFPLQFVSTGLEFLLVPVVDLATLKSIAGVDSHLAPGVFVFCREGYEPGHTIAARMLAAGMGIAEDPATGSANGCLAAYILRHGYLDGEHIDIRVGQGYEIQRPSCLYLRARVKGGDIEVNVGGKVRVVASGILQAV